MTLEHNKCQVVIAENGKKGLEVLSELKDRPDLIICDIMMPEMNGYDFFDAVSNDAAYGDIPFIFLSALDTPEDIRLGKILGADDYLTKPINEDDLLAVIAGKIKRSKKVSFINKMGDARKYLVKAQQIAEKQGRDLWARKISYNHDKLLEQIEKWEKVKKEKDTVKEKIELDSLKETLDLIMQLGLTEAPELIDELPIMLLVISEGGIPAFSNSFTEEWSVDEDIISSFISAFNSFSEELFSKGLDRAKFGDNMLVLDSIGSLTVCYLFKGQSYLAKQRLIQFTRRVQNTASIWKAFKGFKKTHQPIDLSKYSSLQSIITEIFLQKSSEISTSLDN